MAGDMAGQAQQRDDGIAVSIDRLIAMRDEVALAMAPSQQAIGLTRVHGQSPGRRHGTGVDFEDLRLYQHGDDVRHIDWNATARLGETYLKRYREERERLCVIVVDLRSSMAFGTQQKLKSVAACELAATVAWLAASQGYRVGAVVAAPRSTEASRPRTAPQGTLDALGLIARQHAALLEDWRVPPSGLDNAMQIMRHALIKGGRAVLITGGADPGEEYDSVAQQLAPQQQLMVYVVQDPLECPEQSIPVGMYPFRSHAGAGIFSVAMARHGSLDERRAQYRRDVIARYSVNHVPVITTTSAAAIKDWIAPLAVHDFY